MDVNEQLTEPPAMPPEPMTPGEGGDIGESADLGMSEAGETPFAEEIAELSTVDPSEAAAPGAAIADALGDMLDRVDR